MGSQFNSVSYREGRTIRVNTNRREDLLLQQELEDVNNKTISEIKIKRHERSQEAPTENEIYTSKMKSQFISEPLKRERKSQPVFHDFKTKDMKPDQLLIMPSIPPYSPVDSGPQVVLSSRSRKFPYTKKKIVTIDEMRKPHISTLGVVPIRDSLEIPQLKVILEGDAMAPNDTETQATPKLYKTTATSFFVPKLPLQEMETVNEAKHFETIEAIHEIEYEDQPEVPAKMPAILSGVGTTTTIRLMERSKPAPKISYRPLDRNKSARAKRAETTLSIQSSFKSADMNLKDDAMFSQHDDDDGMDAFNKEEIETSIGVAAIEGSVKSVKALLEEAQRISRANDDVGCSGSRKSSVSRRSSKSAKSTKDDKDKDQKKVTGNQDDTSDIKRAERTVDEIIASLKDQSAYNIETEADKKIKEIMNRVMSRTAAVLDAQLDTREDEPETTADTGENAGFSQDSLSITEVQRGFMPTPEPHGQTQTRVEGSIPDASGYFQDSSKKGPQDNIGDETGVEALSLTTRTTETHAAMANIVENENTERLHEYEHGKGENDLDGFIQWDIQQVWEDLLAPPEATAEDILNVQGDMKYIHEKPMDSGAVTKPGVSSSSMAHLASWTPASVRQDELTKLPYGHSNIKNIHHFCTMTSEIQLPSELMHTGRKYHAPDRFPSMMPDQPYRFALGQPTICEDYESSIGSCDRIEQAAERIVSEACEMNYQHDSVSDWEEMAKSLLGEKSLTVMGEQIELKADESQVYWYPAPPKLGASSMKVRELLFTQYQIVELDEFGRPKVPVKEDREGESTDEEEEVEMSPEDKEAMNRTMLKRHNSAEFLTIHGREKTEVSLMKEGESDGEEKHAKEDITIDTEPSEDADGETKDVEAHNDLILTARSSVKEGNSEIVVSLPTEPQHDSEHQSQRDHSPRRPRTAPNLIADCDDSLLIPQDFNTALYEISEQKKLLEKAKRQIKVQETFDELKLIPEQEEYVAPDVEEISEVQQVFQPVKKVEDELTPAEKALLAGRNYVILPKKKKKKKNHRPIDMARIEAVEKFLATTPVTQLERHQSTLELNRVIEREFRVPWHIRTHRSSIPDLLNFEEYKTRKRMPKGDNEREWVRGIWNTWFDQIFPPTPDASEGEEEDDDQGDEGEDKNEETKKEKESKKQVISTILSQDIDAIDPIMETPEDAEIYQILTEEIDKLSNLIADPNNSSAFDLCRRGALYRKVGLLKKAESDLDRAIKMEPDFIDAYWHRHLLYILQDRKASALEDLNHIMKKNKNHAGAYRSMAEIYKKQEDITMAIINYSSAIKSNPIDHEAYYQRAQLYEERGEMLLAMEDYTKAMKILPSRTDAIMKHAMYYFENENWQNSINDFTELLKVDSLNATARLFRGRAYAKLNYWVPAVEDLSAAIHLDPYNWQAFYQRACILRKAHPKRALQDFSVSLLINDSEENVMSYLHRGILYDAMGKPDGAIPDFESVLKLNKNIAAAHVNLGLIYMTKHLNYHRAIKKFTSAIKVDPTYVRAYVCRAEAFHKIHETKNALKDFTRAIHLRPDMHHFYMYRGQLVLELGNLDVAAFCVRHASELRMDNPTNTFGGSPTQQAVVQSFLKNYDKAVDALVQASRHKPIAPYFMLLGKTHMKAKQFKEGVVSFKQALEKMRPWKKRDPWPPETADAHYLSGLCHMEIRNYSDALHQFNFAIKFNPSHADAFYQRGLAAVKMKQMKGIQDFNRALALNPKIFQAYLSRACYYGLKGKYAKAILNCNEAIKLQPKSVRAYLYRGSLKYHIKAYELAILDLSKAASIDTQCPLPYFNRAVCYHENGQHDKALTDYGIVLLLGSMLNLKVLINRGLLYFEKRDYMNSLFDFQAAAKLSSKDHRIHHTLGLCFHKLNRLKEAISTFTQCLQLKPFFLDGIIARGNVFMDYGHARGLEFARRDYQRALHLNPLCLPARINLAYTAQVSGKLMQAWKHFSAVIEVNPNYKPALEGRAVVNLQMSNVFAAYQDISTAINCGATAELLTNRGVISQYMKNPVMAMQDYQKAIKLDPTFALAYFNAANVYFHTRHFKQALQYYSLAINYNPKDESAFLNSGITKVLLHDNQGALEDFKMAAKLSPYSAHIFFNKANLYAAMQMYDKAEKEYTKALALKPDDALMLERRADIKGKLGRQLEAMKDYKRAVDIKTRPNKLILS